MKEQSYNTERGVNMKRLMLLCLVLSMLFSLTACKSKEEKELEEARNAASAMAEAASQAQEDYDELMDDIAEYEDAVDELNGTTAPEMSATESVVENNTEEDGTLYPYTQFKRLESIIVPNTQNAVVVKDKGVYTLTWSESAVGDVGLHYEYYFQKPDEEFGLAPADEYFWKYLYAYFENQYESLEWCGDSALLNGEYRSGVVFYDAYGNKLAYTHSEDRYEVTYELFILYAEPHKNGEVTSFNAGGTTPPKAENATTDITSGMRNALQSAKNYLSTMPFSYAGLIEQLEYEGYSNSEAVYAADNCGADWYEQAVLCAKNYLDIMPFSRSGLIEQLEFEGYTYEQAVYGVDKVY